MTDRRGRDDRREEKGRLKRGEDRREGKIKVEFSDGEDSVIHEAELVDAAADTEVDLRLSPWESNMQDRPREEILTYPGVLIDTRVPKFTGVTSWEDAIVCPIDGTITRPPCNCSLT